PIRCAGGTCMTAAFADRLRADAPDDWPIGPGQMLVPGFLAHAKLGGGHRCEAWLNWSFRPLCFVTGKPAPPTPAGKPPAPRRTPPRGGGVASAPPSGLSPSAGRRAGRTASVYRRGVRRRPHVGGRSRRRWGVRR